MKIKFICSLFIVALLMVALPFHSEAEAAEPFTTGDGEWDGGVDLLSPSGSNVRVTINDWGSQDRLQVRLCNRATLNCTQYKTIENTPYGNQVTFTNVAMGSYAGDVIKLDNPGNEVSGMISFGLGYPE